MFDINTVDEFIGYIEIECGSPIIKQEITREQVIQQIKKAINYYVKNSGLDSTRNKVLQIKVTDPNNIVLPTNVTNINEIHTSNSPGAFNMSQIIFDQYSLGMIQPGSGIGFDMVSYEIFSEYLTLIDQYFNPPTMFRLEGDNRVIITPTPKVNDILFIDCDAHFAWDDKIYFNNRWILDYATELSRKLWGFGLSKYDNRGLSGGISVNASFIYGEGKSEKEALEAKFKNEFMGGSVMLIG